MEAGTLAQGTITDSKPTTFQMDHADDVVKNPADFISQVRKCEREMINNPLGAKNYIIVEPHVFDHYMNGQPTKYFTYGRGVRVYMNQDNIEDYIARVEAEELKTTSSFF